MRKSQIITESELAQITGNRVVLLQQPSAPKRIAGKQVDSKVILQERGYRNPETTFTPLIFDECIFNEEVNIGDYESAGRVSFEKCIFNRPVKLESRNSIFSTDCQFNSDLVIRGSNGDLSVANLNVLGTLKIIGKITDLKLTKINEGVELTDQSIIISSSLNNLSIDEVFAKSLMLADSYEFEKTLTITNSTLTEFTIGAIVLNTEIKIDKCKISNFKFADLSGTKKILSILNSVVEDLLFKVNLFTEANMAGCSFTNFELSGPNDVDSILNIEKSSIQNLRFTKLYNKGLITPRELSIPIRGIVSFKSTNLGKADFIYCNFSKASLEFENSKITEAFFSETEFPKKVTVDQTINYNQAQLTFGQLANAFQKQGDNIRALEYFSREIESHYKSIQWFSKYFFRKINLWLNLVSNNFGRDWVRGCFFSFSAGLIFFCLLLISTDKYQFGSPSLDFSILPAYFKFMNPLRFFELESLFNNTPKQGSITLSVISYAADFAGRVFIAYGYYQTIQAFRRFGRSIR